MSYRRLPYLILAWTCIALGAAGIVLPILPTTPFLLVAAWAAPRASPRLDAWLVNHPRLGPPLLAWRREGAVPRRAKWVASALLVVSWVVMALHAPWPWIPLAAAVFFSCVALFIWTRPLPRAECGRPGGA